MKKERELDAVLCEICKLFCIDGEYVSHRQVEIGNVNKTFIVTVKHTDATKQYIIQRINTYAFKNTEQLMNNIDLVTSHLRKKRPDMRNLHFHHTADRKAYVEYDGGLWRLSNYLESITFCSCTDPYILRCAGAAFGDFQLLLSDFDASVLYETIPDFHDTAKRLEKLFTDAEEDACGRVCDVREELDYIRSVRETACSLIEMQREGLLPLRVTHNDTKINNVLFDCKTKLPICVIDLDTVMPGLVGSDFGDAVRSACNSAEEDCADTDKVSLNLDMFRAFTEGFLSEVGHTLTLAEIETLPLSCFTISVELASRFLDDYIFGDKYFKISYPEHNLVRTRCQLALAKDILRKKDAMDAIVREYINTAKNK